MWPLTSLKVLFTPFLCLFLIHLPPISRAALACQAQSNEQTAETRRQAGWKTTYTRSMSQTTACQAAALKPERFAFECTSGCAVEVSFLQQINSWTCNNHFTLLSRCSEEENAFRSYQAGSQQAASKNELAGAKSSARRQLRG
jgi:hypothetical protein